VVFSLHYKPKNAFFSFLINFALLNGGKCYKKDIAIECDISLDDYSSIIIISINIIFFNRLTSQERKQDNDLLLEIIRSAKSSVLCFSFA